MRRFAAVLAALSAASCASLAPAPSAHLSSEVRALRDCAQWYRELDERVDAAGVRDAQDSRIAGFPYLRVNRLLSSYRAEAAADQRVLGALVERMQDLDIEARRREAANLPVGGAESRGALDERLVLQRASGCSAVMREADLADPSARAAMLERAVVPDDYSSASRVLGLYALSRVPFGEGVRRHQDEVRASFVRELTVPPGATLVRYAPPSAAAMPRAAVAAMLAQGAANPLGIPELREGELEQLFAAYAPTFEIEVAGDHDRFGALRWLRDSPLPAVNAAELAVYRQPAWTRYQGRTLLQLVYTIWFPERPPESDADILAGKLDGVTWRVTLAPDGEPLLYDTMHPCGCYHMFFPTPRAEARPAPEGAIEFMFSPQSLPRVAEGERPLVRIAARTHYVERVALVRGADSLVRYELRPADELRSLARLEGGRASVFGPDGLIAGTERPERFLFWPMGIPSAGAMRQWGRHSTAFVGRRHFDDADLLEKRFTLHVR
jgi:hypothetical protein